MKMKATIVFLIWLTISVNIDVNAISCHQCSATINCESKDTECPEDQNACQKKIQGILIEKSCNILSACVEEQNKCKNGTCQVFCCRDDYCNASSSIYMNEAYVGILMISLALIVSVIIRDHGT